MLRIQSAPFRLLFGCYFLLVTWPLSAACRVLRLAVGLPLRPQPVDRSAIHSIALIRLDEMGDFVIFSSILRPLREAFPQARIVLFMTAWVAPLAELCPYVDEIVPVPSQGSKLRSFLRGPFHALRFAAARLTGHFDLVVNARGDRDTRNAGLLAAFSLAPYVVGFPASAEPVKTIMNRGHDRFYTHLLPVRAAVHEIERTREILRFLNVPDPYPAPELWLSDSDRAEALDLSRCHPLICLGIHSGLDRRRWPLERYQELVRLLAPIADFKFLVVGSPHDYPAGELLRPALGPALLNLAGKTSLRASAAAIDHCSLYIGSDSGPMHLAAALGKPVIEISCHPATGDPAHFQSPRRFAPLTNPAIVLAPQFALPPCRESCEQDQSHCIRQVTVGQVFTAVTRVLNQSVLSGEAIAYQS